jgi:hypothetical protein
MSRRQGADYGILPRGTTGFSNGKKAAGRARLSSTLA